MTLYVTMVKREHLVHTRLEMLTADITTLYVTMVKRDDFIHTVLH